MTINVWGRETPNPIAIVNDGGDQNNPAVADLGGAEFAVAWVDGTTVTLKFFDEQGNVNPALQQALMTDGIGTDIKDLHLAGGGAGMGYGAAWSETNGGVTQLKLRYFDGVAGAVRGDEIAISTNSAVNQHDMELSAYGKDDARGRPIVDGFDAVWVEGNGGAHALGAIYVQRFGVPLDARRDPSGPPAASGIDGVRGAGSDAQLLIAASGRDPSIVGLHAHVGGANETVITWIDATNNINIRVYSDAGAQLNTLGVTATNLNTAGRPLAAGAQQHVTAIQGGGFVVAWVSTNGSGDNVLVCRVFTPGAAAGTWAASAAIVLDQLTGSSNSISDFSLATLETGGFAVSWNATDNGTQAIFSRTYSSGGVPAEPAATIFHAPADATHVAISGLVGDRYVAVYQDNSTPGDPSNVMARILDPRLDSAGDPIVLNGEGLLLIGDPDFATRGRTTPDVLVGTIGKDQIDGRLANDILDGGLGDDVIAAGGGDDSIDGGGGNDTLILTGRFTLDGNSANDDYLINHLGGGLFQITDKRANADGADIVRSMETFEFVGSATSYTFEELAGVNVSNITPTAWGWTDEDADVAPNANAIPDVDGFLVNAATRAGIQGNASVADRVGEFVAVVWENAATVGADTHIRGQFFDVILAPDSFIPNTLNISDGIGIETNPVVSSGGANSGWGFAWEQRDNASDTTRELRTNFVGPGQLTGPELSVLVEANVDQHDAAIFGSFLDRTLASPVGGSVLPTGMSDGYNIVWVSTHADGVDGSQPAGYGRIMLQRFEVPLDALGNPGAAVAGGIDGIANLDNAYGTMDAAVWVGDEDANGLGGLFGRNPSTSALHTFETGIVWIAQDGAGHEKVMFRAYDDLGKVISYPAGNNISAGYAVAAGTNAHIVSAGAVNFAIVWITADVSSPSGYTVMGTMLSSAGNSLDGVGFGFGAPGEPFVVAQLPAGFDPATSNFQATGLSGEDSNDLAISWSMDNGATGIDMMAQHVRVALDPVTGIALNMKAEGDVIRVNATASGNQTDGVVAGLLGDRFIAIYTDNNGAYTDGSDLVGRVIDTRDPENPEPIVGDLIQPGGRIQARRDVIVGTNGNDDILADIQNNDGLVDWVYAGMGDDTIQGGPGLRGAAGIPEIIDGGEGNDTAVYTGRLQDYSITVNGDGSLEVIDLRVVRSAQGVAQIHDGIDNLYSIENLKFLDLSNNGASAQTITLGFPGAPPALNPNYDGTPVAWSLTDTTTFKEITVGTDPTPANLADRPAGIVVTNLQDGAGLAWTRNGNQVWAIAYDTTGTADPVLLGQNTQLTSGAFSGNSVRDIDVAMSGGLGMTTVWESAVAFAQPVIDAAAAARNAALTAYNNAVAASNSADAAAATAQAFADTTDAPALQIVADAAAQQAALTDAAALQTQLTAALAADAAVVTAQGVLDAAITAAGLTDADALQTQLTAAQAADAAVVTAQGALDAATTEAGLTDAAALQTQLTAAQAADAAALAAQAAATVAINADAAMMTALNAYMTALAADQAADAAAVSADTLADGAEAADVALAAAQTAAANAATAAAAAAATEAAALAALNASQAALAALQVDNGKDPLQANPLLAGVLPLVERRDTNNDGRTDYLRYNGVDHVVIGGTSGNDTIISGDGDDTLWGWGGDDTLEAGYGVDIVHGGDGDDIITNAGTDIGAMDFLHGEGGDDVINGGSGLALIFGNEGSDFLLAGPDGKHLLGGLGTDFVRGGEGLDFVMGNEGDDWLEGGDHFDTLAGENSELFFNSSIIGHDVMNGGKSDTDYDAESGDDIMFQGEGIQRNNGMAGFDWIIQKGDPNAANIDLGIPLFATQEAFILRDRNDLVEGASGWIHDDVIVGRAKVVGARAELQNTAAIPGPNSILESFSNALLEKNVDLIHGLRELVAHKTRVTAVDANGVAYTYTDANGVVRQEQIVIDTSDASDILLGGGGSDVISGLGGDDIIDGDKWLNVRVRINDANGNEIGSADGMTTQVFSPTGQLLFGGRTLDALMFDRTLNPGQLEIVREIIDGDPNNMSVDVAVFTDIMDRYTITGNADGSITVSHTDFNAANFPVGPEGALNPVSDGTDRLFNIEKLRFWDGINGYEEFFIGQLVPFVATGAAIISDTTPLQGQLLTVNTASIADQNGLGVFQYQWQRSANGTTWQNIVGATASSFALPDAAGTAAGQYFGDLIRVVVTFVDGIGDTETIISAATSPVGINYSAANSNNGVTLSGRAGDDVIVGSNQADTFTGMAGDDIISGGGGADNLFGGDGNDVLSGGAGGDTLNGGAGDDVLTGGTGNDILGGGLGTDRVDYTGAILNYTFTTNGTDIIITDTIGNDGQDTIRNVETLRFGATDYTIVLGGADADTALSGPVGLVASKAIFGLAGGDTLIGGTAGDILVGGAGNDTINGGEGNDFIYQIGASDGRDFIDGGAGTDTYVLMGAQGAETFRIYTRTAWLAVAGNTAASLNGNTEIVITRGGTNNNSIIAELDNIEEIKVNALNTTANNGNNAVAPDGGTSGGDTILVIGDFRSTSLDYNTIRVEGTGENDTIDITALESAHRVVFDSNGGSDTIIGQVRDQDIFTGEGINDQRTTTVAGFGASDGLDALVAGMAAGNLELTRYMPVREELANISANGIDLIDFMMQTDLMLDTDLGRTMVSQDHLVPLDIVETLETVPDFDRSSAADLFVSSPVRHTSEGLAYILG